MFRSAAVPRTDVPVYRPSGGSHRASARVFSPSFDHEHAAQRTDRLTTLSTMSDAQTGNGGIVVIRPATLADAAAIAEIYNREVTETTATFDLVPRTLVAQQEWLSARSGAFAAIVGVVPANRQVVTFASLSPYKERAAYRTTVEDSIYVHRDFGGRGIGKLMLEHLVDVARQSGFHSVIARIEASSAASRALHAACGFDLVGIEREVGRKFHRWLDVAVMQRLL
jgi:L-amino acid N-acyltransferase YncA